MAKITAAEYEALKAKNNKSKSQKLTRSQYEALQKQNQQFVKERGNVIHPLVVGDTDFGKVSYNALEALSYGNIDGYEPVNDEERAALEKFKAAPINPLKLEDGKDFGNVSYNAIKALQSDDAFNYQSGDETEMKALTAYKDYLYNDVLNLTDEEKDVLNRYGIKPTELTNDSWAKKWADEHGHRWGTWMATPDDMPTVLLQAKTTGGFLGIGAKPVASEQEQKDAMVIEKMVLGDYSERYKASRDALLYVGENIGAGIVGGIHSAGNWMLAAGISLARPFTWGSWNQKVKDNASSFIEMDTYGDMWKENIESRYELPDWYRQYVGGTAHAFGNLIPAMAAEYFTAGVAPGLESSALTLGSGAVTAGANASKVSTTAKAIASKMLKPKASDVMFFSSAASSAAHEGYKQSGDFDKSMQYGFLSGLGELATERLFGGIGGSKDIGPDDLFDLSKSKLVGKITSIKGGKTALSMGLEGVEEMIMAAADPFFQKITVNPNAEINLKDIVSDMGESAIQGILLSGFSRAATFPVRSTQKHKAIDILNTNAEAINAMFKDDADKFEPLKYNATEAEMEARQKQIAVFRDAYLELVVSDVIASNPDIAEIVEGATTETAEALASSPLSAGDVFVDTKYGGTISIVARDGKNTTVETNYGKGTEQKVITNEQANVLIKNGQYARVVAGAVTDVIPTATVYNTITSGNVTAKQIDLIISTPSLKAAFEQLTGVKLAGTKAEQRSAVRGWVGDSAKVSTLTHGKVGLTSDHATVVSLLKNPVSGNIRTIARSEALTKAFEELTGATLAGDLDAKREAIRANADAAIESYNRTINTGFNTKADAVTNTAQETLENAPVTNGVADTANNLGEAFTQDADGKIRFNQTDIDYTDTTMRKGQFNVKGEGNNIKTETGYLRGKYGIAKNAEAKKYSVYLLQSGLEVGQFKTLTEAKKAATYMDDNLAFNDVTYRPKADGKFVINATDELNAYMGAVKQVLDTKPYDAVEVTVENTETITETPEASSEQAKVSVGDVYTAEGKTYTITGRDDKTTTYTVTDADGKVTTRKTGNVTADVNFTKADVYTREHSGAVETTESAYKHLYDEKKVSKEYLDSVNPEIENAVMSIRRGDLDSVPAVIDVAELNADTIKTISDLVGFDVTGYTCRIEKDALIHIDKRHGLNGEHDHSLSDPKDTARMGYVINNSDDIDWIRDEDGGIKTSKKYKDKNNKPAKLVMMQTKIDGTYCVSDVVPDGKNKTIWITSARIQKKHQDLDDNSVSPKTTSENALRASDDIVSQENPVVKNNDGQSEKNPDKRASLSSMGTAFFDNENITADEFREMLEDGSYKEYKGYRDYVDKTVEVYKQSRGLKNVSDSDIAEIERQIEGVINIGIAAAKAGYNIFDSGEQRNVQDSKNRLLFSSLEPNSDYITSSDISAICDKRKNFAEIYDAIVKLEEERAVPVDERFFSNVDNYFILHKLMADKGLTVPCEECYVESMRKNLAPMARNFIKLVTESDANNKANDQLYHQEGKDKGGLKKNNAKLRDRVRELCSEPDALIKLDDLTMQMLTTADGLAQIKLQAPRLYEAFNSFYGQSKPKMPRAATPFRPGELIALLTDNKGKIKKGLVDKIKSTGGFRLQSYSDFQIENFVDVMQTIFEASMLGLNGHAYTKVPAFLEATKGTNLKRNVSIFMYEDGGKWLLDKKNSFPMELEDIYALVASDDSGNTSIIAVSQNADMSAWIMANDKVGYGIPFHKSGLKMDVVRARVVKKADGTEVLGYANMKDHTAQQSEVYKRTISEKKKENTKVSAPINIYSFWDFENKQNLSQKALIEKNLKRYIDECEKRNYRPKFREYLMNNGAVLQNVLRYAKELGFVSQDATIKDIAFRYGDYTIPYGYYKFLGDFGMFKPDGTAAPIETLSLENYDFDNAVAFFEDAEKLRTNELLQQFENGTVREKYRKMIEKGDLTTEQLKDIINEKRSEIAQDVVRGKRASLVPKSYVPTFYSHMGKTIDEMKQDKIGAQSVVPYLKGKGVKNEEIKWSGIEAFLEGKKSVTKAELQEFAAGSMLQIETKELSSDFTIDYTEDESKSLNEISEVMGEIWQTIDDAWMDKYGDEIPWDIRYNDNAVSAMYREINRRQKNDTTSGDFFNDIIRSLNRIEVLERNEQTIVQRAKSRTLKEKGGATRYENYTLDGGSNYRELLFKLPGSIYKNGAMETHWGDEGVLAHARVQDFEVDGKKMLFIEEIQSDWHNEGQKKGYRDASITEEAQKVTDEYYAAVRKFQEARTAHNNDYHNPELREEFEKWEQRVMELADKRAEVSLEAEQATEDAPFRDNYHEYVLKNLIRMAAENGYDSIGWTTADIQSNRWSDQYAEGYRIEYDQDIPKFLNKYGKKWGAKVGNDFVNPLRNSEKRIAEYETDIANYKAQLEKIGDDASQQEYIDFLTEGIADMEASIERVKGTKIWSMPITEAMKDSVLYEGQTLYSLEREANNDGQIREGLLPGNSGRTSDESSGEQTGKLSDFERKNQGKTREERQSFARELIERRQVETVIDGSDKYTLVKPEAYNDDMRAMVEEAAERGLELGFFVGNARIKFDAKGFYLVNGIKVSDNKLLVQYDGVQSPQMIAKHEEIHAKWYTPEMQQISSEILDSISEEEKEAILSQDRYKDYLEMYDGNKDLVWEEFVADVLSGMNEYTAQFIDTVNTYWYGDEAIDIYSPSEYTNTMDAGGTNKRASYEVGPGGDLSAYITEDGELNSSEWDEFYNSLGALERGMWFPQTADGDYIFETEDKLIFTDGDYLDPKINSVVVFEGLSADEIEYGKEAAYRAAQRNKTGQECYEAIGYVLGQEHVTRTNPYPDKAYTGSKNSSGEGSSSRKADRGTKSKVKYSLADNGTPSLFEAWDEATNDTSEEPAPQKTESSAATNSRRTAKAAPTAKENEWVDGDATTSPAPEEIPTASEIVKDIETAFGRPVKSGKVTDRRASGIFKILPEVIRTRVANDIPTIIHELGHLIDKRYGYKLQKSAHIKEAEPLMNVDISQYKKEDIPSELAAEFVRRYFKNPEAIAKSCPNLAKDFLEMLDDKDAKAVAKISAKVHAYMSANLEDLYGATIIDAKTARKMDRRRISEYAHDKYAKWLDGFHAIKQTVDFVEESTGKTKVGKENAYKLATNSRNAHNIAQFVLREGFRDINGDLIDGYDSFVECVKGVDLTNKKTQKAFSEYLKLKHALEIQDKNKKAFPDENRADAGNINRRLAQLDRAFPEFAEAAKKLYTFQYNVLTEFAVKSGLMTQESADFLHSYYPCYVPFFRYTGNKKGSFARKSLANQSSPVMQMKGSGLDTLDHLESIVQNTEKIIAAAIKHQAADVLAQYADTVDGAGAFIERIPPDQAENVVDITELKNKFNEELKAVVNTTGDYFAISDLLDKVFGDQVKGYTPVVNESKRIIAVQRGDDRAYYQIHSEELFEAITEMSPKQLKAWAKMMGWSNALITQYNPLFAITNPFRDFMTAYAMSDIDNPAQFIKGYVNAIKLMATSSKEYKQYKAMGGGHSSSLNAELGNIVQSVKDLQMRDAGFARRAVYAITHHPVQLLTSFADFTESIPRFMEFLNAYEKTGDLQEAMYQADDITTNFKRRGSGAGAKVANTIFRFNNAALQGLDKTRRTFTDADGKRKIQVGAKWLMKAILLAILQSFINRSTDEEGYENLSSYTKNNFYNFAIGDGKFISLPKERENAVLSSAVERVVDSLCGEDDAWYDFFGYVTSQLLPPMVPSTLHPIDAAHEMLNSTLLGPITDVGFNKDFKGSPIESDYEKDLPSNERYNEGTSKLAHALGQSELAVNMDMSPKKIDHLLSGYLGFLASANKAALPMNNKNRDITLGLQNRFVKDSNYSTDVLNKVYENRDIAERKFNCYGTPDTAIEYEQNAVVASYISGMNQAIKALPEEEQRQGRAYLLKNLNAWNYEMTTSQSEMISGLGDSKVEADVIFDGLPKSTLQWTVNKQKYSYQMTPQEYHDYATKYIAAIENARKQIGGNSVESYEKAKASAKEYMSKYKATVLKDKYLGKATKIE